MPESKNWAWSGSPYHCRRSDLVFIDVLALIVSASCSAFSFGQPSPFFAFSRAACAIAPRLGHRFPRLQACRFSRLWEPWRMETQTFDQVPADDDLRPHLEAGRRILFPGL